MPYKDYHVGGGGNCVFFSTAAQIDPDVHGRVRNKISEMYNNPETRDTVVACAKELMTKQFKAGTLNTLLNFELHDYNFKGDDAADKFINKLTSTGGSELNDALSLRMLAQLTTPDAQLLGTTTGNKTSIYNPINATFAQGVYNAIEAAAPGAKLPVIYAVVQQPFGYVASVFKRNEQGKVIGDNLQSKDISKPPTDDQLSDFLDKQGVDKRNLIGLKGEKQHCKAYVDTDYIVSGDTCLTSVTGESRSSIRAIAGIFAGIFATIKSWVTPGKSIASQDTSQPMTVTKDDDALIDDMDKSLDEFDALEDDFVDIKIDEPEEKKEIKPEQLGRQSEIRIVETDKTQDAPTPKPKERSSGI